jgi:hypothetical protein
MNSNSHGAGVTELVKAYRDRYRGLGVVDWEAWVSDQKTRQQSQEPIRQIRPLDAATLEAILCRLAEGAYQEVCTTAFIADYLLSRGGKILGRQEVRRFETELLIGEGTAADLAIRCDLDGVSQGDGSFKHTCGHSLNMAAVVKTWEGLRDTWQADRFWLIFQPAEEGPGREEDGYVHPDGISGGQYLRRKGLYGRIATLISCHVDTALIGSEVRITEGAATAAASRLKWRLPGQPAHAALPWEGHNPIESLRELLIAIQELNARFAELPSDCYGLISPSEVRTAPGEINTLRAWVEVDGIGRLIGDDAERLFEGFCTSTDAVITLESPPVWNSSDLVRIGRGAARELGYSVVVEPARFRDETGWACSLDSGRSTQPDLPRGCAKVLHFFVSGGENAGALHSDNFHPNVDEVLRSQCLMISRIAGEVLSLSTRAFCGVVSKAEHMRRSGIVAATSLIVEVIRKC